MAINISDLSKTYPGSNNPSLDGVTMSIRSGEKFGIFGPNGAGKTTLISLLSGVIQPTQGSFDYSLNEKNLALQEVLPHVGFVPQDFAFYSELTPLQNLNYFGRMYGLSKEQTSERAQSLLETLGLWHVRNVKIKTFSGGMKRRINLAIGLINNPSILFLDEPTVGVDVQSKMVIINLLNKINEQGTTIIYTSHHLKEAEDFCDRITLLDHGKIVALDTLPNLIQANGVENLEQLLIKLTGNQLRD